MSFRAIRWAMSQTVGDMVGKAVLVKLADCMSDTGLCCPSQEMIQKSIEAGNKHTVIKALARLEQNGFIAREIVRVPRTEKNRGGIVTHYSLIGFDPLGSATCDTVSDMAHSATFALTDSATNGTVTYNNILTYKYRHTPTNVSTLKATPRSLPQNPATKPNKVQAPKPEGLDDEEWRDLIAEQKAKRQVLTATRLKAWEREGAKCGLSLIEVCHLVAVNGWQGFDANKHKRFSGGYVAPNATQSDDPFSVSRRKAPTPQATSKDRAIEAMMQGSLL